MLLIKNGHIKPIIGQELENGSILIDDQGKIAAIGTDIPAPENAAVMDAGGRLVTPAAWKRIVIWACTPLPCVGKVQSIMKKAIPLRPRCDLLMVLTLRTQTSPSQLPVVLQRSAPAPAAQI